MEIAGQFRIAAPVERVWRDLHDPEVLKHCIPGCRSLAQLDEHRFDCEIAARFGPLKARFTSRLTIEARVPPRSYVLAGEGSGGAAGFGKGRAHVQLQPLRDGTCLSYVARFTAGGKLSRLGARLMTSTSRKLCDRFFTTLGAHCAATDR